MIDTDEVTAAHDEVAEVAWRYFLRTTNHDDDIHLHCLSCTRGGQAIQVGQHKRGSVVVQMAKEHESATHGWH